MDFMESESLKEMATSLSTHDNLLCKKGNFLLLRSLLVRQMYREGPCQVVDTHGTGLGSQSCSRMTKSVT